MPRLILNIEGLAIEDVKNPYRDLDINPINKMVVDNLVISGKKTGGMWPKWEVRPKDPNVTMEDLEKWAEEYRNQPIDLEFELCYSHNTFVAAGIYGDTTIDAHIQPHSVFTNDIMLAKMAYENKNDAKHNMMVMVETVKQTKEYIEERILAPWIGKDFKEYQEAGGDFFDKKSSFDGAMRENKAGAGLILKVLEGWLKSDVNNTLNVIEDLDAGLYKNSDVATMPSMGVLGQYSRLVAAVNDLAIPEFFKQKFIADTTKLINDPDVSTTVRTLRNAVTAVKDTEKGINEPSHYIQHGKRAKAKFTVADGIFDLVYQPAADLPEEYQLGELADIQNREDFAEFEGLDEIIAEVQAKITKAEEAAAAALAAEEAGEEPPDEEGVEESEELDEEGEDLIAKFKESQESSVELPDVAEVETNADAINAVVDTATQTMETAAYQLGLLTTHADSLDDEEHKRLFDMLDALRGAIEEFDNATSDE